MTSSEHRPGGHYDNNENMLVSSSLIMYDSTYDTYPDVTKAPSVVEVASEVAAEHYVMSLHWVLGTLKDQ